MSTEHRVGEFIVTDEHIALLANMCVGWQDCEYGAPEIDPKRPYGNSEVPTDVYRILGWAIPCANCGVEWTDERAKTIHREMEDVLQLAVGHPCEDIRGTWTRRYSYDKWVRA